MALPTNEEQELLEWTNRLRADPGGEYARLIVNPATRVAVLPSITNALNFFGVDLALFQQQMGAFAPVQPLAWNEALAGAAATHSALMIAADDQSHQLPGEAGLGDRIHAAGYQYSTVGENIYAYASSVVFGHAGFVVDWGPGTGGMQTPAGHRANLLNANHAEIGLAVAHDGSPATSVGPLVITQDLGNRFGYAPQLLGVVFDDQDGDNFYDAGEGTAGVTVTASGAAGTFSTTTWDSGGYQFELPAGSYTVTYAGGGLAGTYQTAAAMGGQNLRLSVEAAQFGPALPAVALSADQTVNEAAVRVTFSVALDSAPTAPVSVAWSVADGTASVAAKDLPGGQAGTVEFNPGDPLSKSFTVLVNDQAHLQEGEENLSVVLANPVGATLARAAATLTLQDDYVPRPAVPLALTNTKTHTASAPAPAPYEGPVSYLAEEFVYLGTDNVNVAAGAPNMFLRSGSGDDALAVSAGQNVLDAGTGSNFLTGGSGADTFFLDARDPALPIWSTVVGLGAGDAVTVWGVSEAASSFTWLENAGAPGFTGLTVHSTTGGGPVASLTLAGLADADRTNGRLAILFGNDPGSGSDYMFIFANA